MTKREELADRFSNRFGHENSWGRDISREAFLAGFDAAVTEEREACLAIVKDCSRTYVENPAIDIPEMMRRAGIRWCGEWIEQRISARDVHGKGED